MAYINPANSIVVQSKITKIGRKLLASGALNFSSFVLGDSEIDYTYAENTGFNISNSLIMRPVDSEPAVKYPILPTSNSATPYTPLPAITPVETLVVNSGYPFGFFTGNTTNGFTAYTSSNFTVQSNLIVSLSGSTGGTVVNLRHGPNFTYFTEPSVGQYLLVNWVSPLNTASTVNGVVSTTVNSNYLWYQIVSITGSVYANTLSVTVDRNVPNYINYSGSVASQAIIYPGANAINGFYGSGSTIQYWNDDTLAFVSNSNVSNAVVPVFNMNLVYTEEQAGQVLGYQTLAYYGSSAYTGTKNYFSDTYDNPSQRALGIIHYSNNDISNVLGEGFYSSSVVLNLPTIQWYNSPGKLGLQLICATGQTTAHATNPNVSLGGVNAQDLQTTYYDLIAVDGQNTVCGKVFSDLKTIIIEDQELLAALSYKANRNYTLPPLNLLGNTVSATGRPAMFVSPTEKLYVSYLLYSDDTSGYTQNYSLGNTTGLHCQYYAELFPTVVNNVVTQSVPQFNIQSSQLTPFMTDSSTFSTGVGNTFNKFYILVQKVSNTNLRPDPTKWQIVDYTSRLANYSQWAGHAIPTSAFSQSVYYLDGSLLTGGTQYVLNNFITQPTTSNLNALTFGDEVFFYGNLSCQISATVFRTLITIQLPFSQYNSSQNPTWDSTSQSVYVSEIGLFDSGNNLISISKLSSPFQKTSSQIRVVQLDMDF